jgi:fructoselysine-6-P-deglycase FrlB-like protein
MSLLQTEIESQPSILQRLLDLARPLAIEAAARIRAFDPHYVVIAARGSSDNAARYAQYLVGAVNPPSSRSTTNHLRSAMPSSSGSVRVASLPTSSPYSRRLGASTP